MCYSQFYYLKNFNRIKAKRICYSQFYHLKNFLTYYLGGTFKFFFWRYVGESGQRADPPPPVCPGGSIRRRAVVSCYRYIVVPIRSTRRYVDTSIRRYVDTSIRRYVDTVTHCSTWNNVTSIRRYGVTALRRIVIFDTVENH